MAVGTADRQQVHQELSSLENLEWRESQLQQQQNLGQGVVCVLEMGTCLQNVRLLVSINISSETGCVICHLAKPQDSQDLLAPLFQLPFVLPHPLSASYPCSLCCAAQHFTVYNTLSVHPHFLFPRPETSGAGALSHKEKVSDL